MSGRTLGKASVVGLPGAKALKRALYAACLAGFYLQLDLAFPYGLYIFAGLLLFLILPKRKSHVWIVTWFGALAGCSVAFVAITPSLQSGAIEQGSSLGLFALTLVASVGLLGGGDLYGRREFSNLFLLLGVSVLIVALAEIAGPLAPISDRFRDFAYSGDIVYGNDARDLASVGFVRPKVFTSEPSHVAKMLGVFLCAFAVTAAGLPRKWLALVLCGIGYVVIGSPAIAAGAVVVSFDLLVNLVRNPKVWRHPGSMVFLAIFALAVVFASAEAFYQLTSRLGLFGGAIEPSAYQRLVAPWVMAMNSIATHPILGFGLGADSTVREIYLTATFGELAPDFVMSAQYDPTGVDFGNMHAGMLIQFGLAGALAWLWLLERTRRMLRASGPIFWMYYTVAGFLIAPLHTPMLWGQLVIVLTALRLRAIDPTGNLRTGSVR